MRIATWNVNSVKVRKDRVVAWLRQHRPDALCLQELKTTDEAYPAEAVRAEGCDSAVFGQKAYNGVALISPHAITRVVRGLGDGKEAPWLVGDDEVERLVGDEAARLPGESGDAAAQLLGEARLIGGEIRGVTVFSAYFPNGRSVGAPTYEAKLAWMGRLLGVLEDRFDPKDPLVLAGDFNVAPHDSDAKNPEKWAGSVLCHAGARDALERIREWGFVDVVRKHHPEGGLYSWWDYRQLGFPKNDGLRIDHVFATAPVAERSAGAWVDRDQRKGTKTDKPSDHAPVVADFDL